MKLENECDQGFSLKIVLIEDITKNTQMCYCYDYNQKLRIKYDLKNLKFI